MASNYFADRVCYLEAAGLCLVKNNTEPCFTNGHRLVQCRGAQANSMIEDHCERYNSTLRDNPDDIAQVVLDTTRFQCARSDGQPRFYHPCCVGYTDFAAGNNNKYYRSKRDRVTGLVLRVPQEQSHHICRECYLIVHNGNEPEALPGR